MPLPVFEHLIEDDPKIGSAIAALGSTVLVVNTNAQQVNSKDPWACLAGTGTNHGNVRPFNISRRSGFVDFFHVYRSAGATVSTSLKIRAYGLVPPKIRGGKPTPWPADVDTNFTLAGHDFYVPLTTPDGHTEADFGTAAPPIVYGSTWAMLGPVSFYVSGCTRIVPLVSQAAVGPTASLLIARLVT